MDKPWFPSENDRENAGFSTSMLVYRRVSSKNGHLPVIQNNQEQCQFFSVIAMQGPCSIAMLNCQMGMGQN